MPFLIAAVVLVGLLGLVNLLFAFGVIRRLRQHQERIDSLGGMSAGPSSVIIEPGQTVADFGTATVDGERISNADLTGTTLIGVFSPGCSACEAQLGEFVKYAASHPGGHDRTLALVVGPEAESASYIERLEATARVVREEDHDGSLTTALGVRGFPGFALVDDHEVRASGFQVAALPAAVAG